MPALRHENEKGSSFVKFDGIELGPAGEFVLLIDAKTKLATFNVGTERELMQTIRRVESALQQNPGYKVIYKFPNARAAARGAPLFVVEGIESIQIRVRGK